MAEETYLRCIRTAPIQLTFGNEYINVEAGTVYTLRKVEDDYLLGYKGNYYPIRMDKEQLESVFQEIAFEIKETEESIDHPKHYSSDPSGVECITVARHRDFAIGNALKYLWRAGIKRDPSMTDRQKEIEDLKKAIWYINDKIKQLESWESQ